MFKSAVRACRHLLVTVVILGINAITDVAHADEADVASAAILARIQERWTSPMPQQDQSRIAAMLRYIIKTVYYPMSAHELQQAAIRAVDAIEAPSESATLVDAAIAGMVESVGHGAHFVTTLGGDAPAEADASAMHSRQIGFLWVVPLPSMSVVSSNPAHTCADLLQYVGQPATGVTGVVLDLRGNQSGALTDSSCLASLFLKKGQPLFQVISKRGAREEYVSEAVEHNLPDLPLAVLIDAQTDSAGMLLAAILQDHKRGTLIGEAKATINGAVSSLVFPRELHRGVILPTGEIRLSDKRPLAAGVRIDIAMSAHDDDALMNAARTLVAGR